MCNLIRQSLMITDRPQVRSVHDAGIGQQSRSLTHKVGSEVVKEGCVSFRLPCGPAMLARLRRGPCLRHFRSKAEGLGVRLSSIGAWYPDCRSQ